MNTPAEDVRQIARRLQAGTLIDAEEAESLAWFGYGVAVVQGVPPALLVLAGYRRAIERIRAEDKHRRKGWFRIWTSGATRRLPDHADVQAGVIARDHVERILRRTHGRDRALLVGMYFEGKSRQQLAAQLGIRRKYVSHEHRRIIRQLREDAAVAA